MEQLKILTNKIFNSIGKKLPNIKDEPDSLLSHEKAYHEFYENFKLIIAFLDKQGRVTHFNSYFSKLTGYTSNEIIGSDWFKRVIPDTVRGEKGR